MARPKAASPARATCQRQMDDPNHGQRGTLAALRACGKPAVDLVQGVWVCSDCKAADDAMAKVEREIQHNRMLDRLPHNLSK